MKYLKPLNPDGFSLDHIIATGGIGSGIFFSLQGDHTLGRNESRMATLLPFRDYCKQHIIMHYIAVLLGADSDSGFQSFPIGKVGNDDPGRSLIDMMQRAGMRTASVTIDDNASTLFSACFQYPDRSGGNITTENSASGKVSPEDIDSFFETTHPPPKKEIILAVPEVPLATRIHLLEYGRRRGSLNVASFLSSEVKECMSSNTFSKVDLLFLNIDEAGHIAGSIEKTAEFLIQQNPSIAVIITDGANGSYCYTQGRLLFTPALKVEAISTAGAGDAFLAGTVTGLCCGLTLEKAVNIGTLLGAFSVTSADTIHPAADAESLFKFAGQHSKAFVDEFSTLFSNEAK